MSQNQIDLIGMVVTALMSLFIVASFFYLDWYMRDARKKDCSGELGLSEF